MCNSKLVLIVLFASTAMLSCHSTETATAQVDPLDEYLACDNRMTASLITDPRFVPNREFEDGEGEAIGRRYNAMTPEQRECGSDVIDKHMDAVFEQCKIHRCGQNIGGGCDHVANYSMTTSLLNTAIQKCSGQETAE